mgnify:CR=1 FL=1
MREISLGFGPATVRLRADEPLLAVQQTLCDWLAPEGDAYVSGEPDATVSLMAGRAPGRPAGAAEWSDATSSGWWDGKAWDGVLQSAERPGPAEWALYLHESPVFRAARIVPDAAIRLAHVHGFGRNEMLASAALYGHLLTAAQAALRTHAATLVHASAVASPDGDAVLLLGRGGAGRGCLALPVLRPLAPELRAQAHRRAGPGAGRDRHRRRAQPRLTPCYRRGLRPLTPA